MFHPNSRGAGESLDGYWCRLDFFASFAESFAHVAVKLLTAKAQRSAAKVAEKMRAQSKLHDL
jgi:hypothetical protein